MTIHYIELALCIRISYEVKFFIYSNMSLNYYEKNSVIQN